MSALQARVRGLTILAALGGIGLVCLYIVFVRTPIGQRWDDRALLGGLLASDEARRALTSALHGIRISTLILMLVLLVAISLVRRTLIIAIGAALAFGGAVISAEVLKRVLPRRDLAPELNAYVDKGNIDTYPSGHSTIAMGFALALIVVSSPRVRTAVAAFGMAWAAAVPMATLAAGWHRPSDVVGGMALSLMWLAGATAFAVRRVGSVGPNPRWTRLLPLIGVGVLVGVAACLLVWVIAGDPQAVPVGGGLLAFISAQALIALTAIVVASAFTYVLRGLSFQRHRSGSPVAA